MSLPAIETALRLAAIDPTEYLLVTNQTLRLGSLVIDHLLEKS